MSTDLSGQDSHFFFYFSFRASVLHIMSRGLYECELATLDHRIDLGGQVEMSDLSPVSSAQ